ncbi:HpcH/HpaI aldolase family protein [Steroidobacter cummioxidans]|uniref:HpcH/HpaI aldolase family protein n=1 Tax=Steroidobacter cummioxidans TaxID=1803913 RepID=UPI000E31EFF7|nr:aldolase/citrate lyase family protein [Steroidobacter cummioxidans]
MSELPRLNGIIKAWEQGRPAYASFAPPGRRAAIEFSSAPYDAVVFEMEHNSWDAEELEVTLQFMLNRKQILESGTLAPTVTPIVRIPANGVENNQWLAKQALDRGVYGVVWPHVSTAEQAYNAVSACRYPRPKDAPYHEPIGMRGDGPHTCSRYWGLTQQEYYSRADVWPLNPKGEVLVFLMIEDVAGVQNLDDILRNVPGIGCVLIGEGDLSQELGVPRQYEHPIVKEAMDQIVATCKKHGMRVGHPHVTSKNVESVVAQGYSFLMSSPVKTYGAIEKARQLAGG